jgi:hypothetical protein
LRTTPDFADSEPFEISIAPGDTDDFGETRINGTEFFDSLPVGETSGAAPTGEFPASGGLPASLPFRATEQFGATKPFAATAAHTASGVFTASGNVSGSPDFPPSETYDASAALGKSAVLDDSAQFRPTGEPNSFAAAAGFTTTTMMTMGGAGLLGVAIIATIAFLLRRRRKEPSNNGLNEGLNELTEVLPEETVYEDEENQPVYMTQYAGDDLWGNEGLRTEVYGEPLIE